MPPNTRNTDGAARLAARAIASIAAVAIVTGGGILRLRRVQQPRATVVSRYGGGAVTVERVTVGARAIGHALRCDGREVYSRLGSRAFTVFEGSVASKRYVVAGDGERVLLLRVEGCVASVRSDTGSLRAVRADGDALRIEATSAGFRWRP